MMKNVKKNIAGLVALLIAFVTLVGIYVYAFNDNYLMMRLLYIFLILLVLFGMYPLVLVKMNESFMTLLSDVNTKYNIPNLADDVEVKKSYLNDLLYIEDFAIRRISKNVFYSNLCVAYMHLEDYDNAEIALDKIKKPLPNTYFPNKQLKQIVKINRDTLESRRSQSTVE